jgi:hypothetical protein
LQHFLQIKKKSFREYSSKAIDFKKTIDILQIRIVNCCHRQKTTIESLCEGLRDRFAAPGRLVVHPVLAVEGVTPCVRFRSIFQNGCEHPWWEIALGRILVD